MIALTLAQIAEITSGQCRAEPGAVITGEVVIDSRQARPGGLFAAVAGERADGHEFAPAAVNGEPLIWVRAPVLVLIA